MIEPLPGFEIIKDLVVDMDAFWEKYERVQPWLHAEAADFPRGQRGTPA